ncbi:MAG: hypothetical protein FWD18_09820 [Micrococcales bacterium]|nr:hypothetical protein [Micrococcales bacterium]
MRGLSLGFGLILVALAGCQSMPEQTPSSVASGAAGVLMVTSSDGQVVSITFDKVLCFVGSSLDDREFRGAGNITPSPGGMPIGELFIETRGERGDYVSVELGADRQFVSMGGSVDRDGDRVKFERYGGQVVEGSAPYIKDAPDNAYLDGAVRCTQGVGE